MKRILLIAVIVMLAAFVDGAGFTLNLGISHPLESGRFFDSFNAAVVTEEGVDAVAEYRNRLGVGFDLYLEVEITPRLFLIPGAGIRFGHQEVVTTPVDTADGEDSATRNEYFRIFSGYMHGAYRVLRLKNNWHLDLLGGLGSSRIQQDGMALRTDGTSFWDLRLGAAASFRELLHWGVRFQVLYHLPLNPDYPGYISLQGGFLYRL